MSTLTKRGFLKRASGIALAVGFGPIGVRAQPRDVALDALAAELSAGSAGRVVRPGGAEHGKIKYYNARFDCRRSTVYIQPRSAAGVRTAIAWARQHNRTFAVRGAGHSFEGKSSHPDLVIDMSQMTAMSFRDGILDVEAGVLLGQVYETLGAAGYILPGGTCPTVGLVGHTLGGGIGDFLPTFGYAAQALTSATLVTFGGAHVRVSDSGIDVLGDSPLSVGSLDAAAMMRALRGAGQGTFGIVTNMSFKAADVRSAKIASFKLEPSGDVSPRRVIAILQAWFSWRASLPKSMQSVVSSKVNLSRSGGSYGLEIAGLIVIQPSAVITLDDVRRTLEPLFQMPEFSKKGFDRGLNAARAIKTFIDDDETSTNSKRKMLYGSSSAIDTALSPDAIQHLVKNLRSNIFVSLYTSGGHTKSAPLTSLYPSEFLIEWSTYAPRRDAAAHRRIRDLSHAVMRIAGAKDHAFPNYPDADARDYFAEAGPLRRLRETFDPGNLSTSSLLSGNRLPDSTCG